MTAEVAVQLPNLYQVFPSVFGEDTHDPLVSREREGELVCVCSCAWVYKQSPPLPIAPATTAVGTLRRFGPASWLMLMFIAT